MRPLTRLSSILIVSLAFYQIAQGEEGVLWVQVSNPLGQPISGLVLSAAGPSSTSPPTADNGITRIKLASDTRVGHEVELVIVKAAQDLVFISPWQQRVTVPCFENDTRCVSKVVLAERGSRMLLEYPPAQFALAAKVNAANAVTASSKTSEEARRQSNLAEVAKAYGYTPEEVDSAIRNLGKKTVDPFQLGQVALYARNYPEAEKQLLKSKGERRDALADVSYSLGQTYYEQDKYRESVTEFEEAAALRPDCTVLIALGVTLRHAERYVKAESVLKRALETCENTLGTEHSTVAYAFRSLANLYRDQNRYGEAEPLFKRALAINERQRKYVDISLQALAELCREQGRYEAAELLYRRALAISEKRLGPRHPEVAYDLGFLADLYRDLSRYREAEGLYKRALAIREKQLGTEHLEVASSLYRLAPLYNDQGRYAEAEPLLKRALAITEDHLGSEHPKAATSLMFLANFYREQGKGGDAEALYKRALAIREKQLGPEHSEVASMSFLQKLCTREISGGDSLSLLL